MASPDEIELVLERLEQLMPSGVKLIIGGSGTYSKEELIQHVKENDAIGQLVVRAHMLYLRSFKDPMMHQNRREWIREYRELNPKCLEGVFG